VWPVIQGVGGIEAEIQIEAVSQAKGAAHGGVQFEFHRAVMLFLLALPHSPGAAVGAIAVLLALA
jgi:hypothetical protein